MGEKTGERKITIVIMIVISSVAAFYVHFYTIILTVSVKSNCLLTISERPQSLYFFFSIGFPESISKMDIYGFHSVTCVCQCSAEGDGATGNQNST